MNDELKALFDNLGDMVDKVGDCCGCNTVSIDYAIQDIKDYLTANPECNNTYHGKEGYDCCN